MWPSQGPDFRELAIRLCPALDLEDPTGHLMAFRSALHTRPLVSSSSGCEGELTAEVGGHGVLLGETQVTLDPAWGLGPAWASHVRRPWPQVTPDSQPCRLSDAQRSRPPEARRGTHPRPARPLGSQDARAPGTLL